MTKYNKFVLIMVSILVVLIAIITAMAVFKKNSRVEANEKKETKVSEVILDECTDEYEMQQNKTVTTAIVTSKKVNSNKEKDKHYILKDVDGKIVVYQIENNGEEILYEKTEISTEYLPDKDKALIVAGIEVKGEQKLNELLESFE